MNGDSFYMLAEHPDKTVTQWGRTLTMIAVYEREEEANELLERLAALSVNTGEASLIRIAVNDNGSRRKSVAMLFPYPEHIQSGTRSAAIGSIIGGLIAILISFALYSFNFLNLTLLEGLVAHTLALVVLGAVLGAAIGALMASSQIENNPPLPSPQATDGFLVFVRTPTRLAKEAETIARQLGAKEIIF